MCLGRRRSVFLFTVAIERQPSLAKASQRSAPVSRDLLQSPCQRYSLHHLKCSAGGPHGGYGYEGVVAPTYGSLNTKLAPRGAWLRQKSCQEISCTVVALLVLKKCVSSDAL